MVFCQRSPDSCEREFWAAVPPIAFVAVVVAFSLPIPVPRFVSKAVARVCAPFLPTLTLAEAEELEHQFEKEDNPAAAGSDAATADERGTPSSYVAAPRWRSALFALLAATEATGWIVAAVFNVVDLTKHDVPFDWRFALVPFMVAATWVYALVSVLRRPPVTPPYGLFMLAILHIVGGAVILGGQLYASPIADSTLPRAIFVAEIVNLGLIAVFLVLILSLPLNAPSPYVNQEKLGTVISPEDHTSFISWITFSWLHPVVNKGSKKKLEDEDVWEVSPTLKTRPTFHSYRQIPASGVFWKVLRANSMDLIAEFILTELSVVLDFGAPFFLNRILKGLENPESTPRSMLYLYAMLAFMTNLLKAENDLQHLWYGRRAASRIGTQLSAAIYDKALRICDQSGVVSAAKDEGQNGAEQKRKASEDSKKAASAAERTKKDKKDKKEEAKDEEDNKGADVGKIVNLMGIDCQRVQNQVSAMPFIYTAPMQLTLSCIYLYNLLGFSAFAGFLSLLIALPFSQWLANATMRITKGTLAAKDGRMKLVNEMFGAIKFIKFFAWENQWIQRIMDARMVEIKWLRKARNVNVMYSLLWTLVPSFVSIVSFFVYIYTGHELRVSTAFTAIRLFDMLRQPLGVVPYSLVALAQMKVSLGRLNAFFREGEVPDDVCGLTRQVRSENEELKIENATFRWTSVKKDNAKETTIAKSNNLSDSEATVGGSPSSSNDEGVATASTSTRTAVDSERNGDKSFELQEISLEIAPGKLTVITGPTASGKTALLLALLGEMNMVSGKASLPKNPTIVDENGLKNSISYAAQTPWLQQLSIKDNIVFGYPFDQQRYDAVIDACALLPDFNMLEDGDLTEIGSKGVSLSGGQKARVALARAVYAPTQYLILDDIFSAVDSHTARFLFERLFKGPLLKHRAVVLVTHHVDLVLPGTHYVVQMLDGRIGHQGTLEELKQKGILDFVAQDPSLHATQTDEGTSSAPEGSDPQPATKPKQARKLVEDEARAEGRVKLMIYKTYVKASSYFTWVCVLLGIIAAETFDVGTRLWISIWGSAYRQPAESISLLAIPRITGHFLTQGERWPVIHNLVLNNVTITGDISANFPNASEHPFFYVSVYCGIGILAVLVSMCTEWVLFTGGLRGGRVLFERLLTSLSAATFRFYDTTPTGRILNRFGKDFDTIDGMLPFMLHHMTTAVAAFLAAVITVIAVVPWFLPLSLLIAYFYVRLSIGYLSTSRDLRRMESTSRSPILAGFADLMDGIITVRAFSAEKEFLHGHYKRVDTSNKFWYFTWMLNRWLLVRFDAIGACSVFTATLFVLSGYISAGLAGLAIVSSMTFSMSVYWSCRAYTELELCLNSVERVVEYLDVPKEPPAIVESKRVPAYWPSTSDSDSLLVVEDLKVKYAPELPSVLHGISFALKARERVGLLGRTGCGKSTLAMSLLRFVDPHEGKIMIDGIDISTIGTHDLRSRVTFIAQDQALFLGTVRSNLDPFDEHTDAECLDALARVHLITEAASESQKNSRETSRAASLHEGDEGAESPPSVINSDSATQVDGDNKITITLDTNVSAGGQNFSNGQRQLLAMARALLRQSGVVIMDEATSSIDKATDVKIQATIREEFNQSLLLTIAHRLETIIDFDRLLVLDKGHLVEFDTPINLIHKEDGIFREMCIQSGKFTELEAAAAKAQG